jgi:HlyD family secretion protein
MMKERITKLIVLLSVLALIAVGVRQWREGKESELPEGLSSGNGRIEAEEVDVATGYPGRITRIHVDEGGMVRAGETLAEMDTAELDSQLAQAQALVEEAKEGVNEATAMIAQRESELKLAEQELQRALLLVEKGSVSRRTVDQRQGGKEMALAGVNAAKAHLETTRKAVAAAVASAQQIKTRIDDCFLKAPVGGRVLYRLAEEGEVLGAGGKVLTLLDLSHVYMEIFLPAQDAARLAIGSEARIVLDAFPGFALPAVVEFVSPEAQFTPKQVETLSEREKLMFRVKLQVPRELVMENISKVKTGVRGVGYVRTDEALEWPDFLRKLYTGRPMEAEIK